MPNRSEPEEVSGLTDLVICGLPDAVGTRCVVRDSRNLATRAVVRQYGVEGGDIVGRERCSVIAHPEVRDLSSQSGLARIREGDESADRIVGRAPDIVGADGGVEDRARRKCGGIRSKSIASVRLC